MSHLVIDSITGQQKVSREAYIEARKRGDMAVISDAARLGIAEAEIPTEEAMPSTPDEGVSPTEHTPAAVPTPEDIVAQERKMRETLAAEHDAALRRIEELERATSVQQQERPVERQDNTVLEQARRELEAVDAKEYETEYDRLVATVEANKKLVAALSDTQSVSGDPRISALLAKMEEDEARAEEESRKRKLDGERQAVVNEWNTFWSNHGELKTEKPFDTLESEYVSLRKKLSETYGVDHVDRIVARLGDPSTEGETRSNLSQAGIEVFNEFPKLWETIRVWDYMNGRMIDPATGKKIPVTGKSGNVQVLADMDTAYFLMNKNQLLAEQRRAGMRMVQERLNARSSPIVTGPTVPVGGDGQVSTTDVRQIFAEARANPLRVHNDPTFRERYNAAKAAVTSGAI